MFESIVVIEIFIGIVLIAGWKKANITIRKMYRECGMLSEEIKYNDRLNDIMLYAKSRHKGLKFIESYKERQ